MELRKDSAVGVIPVYKKGDGEFLLCLIQDENGFWGFPKGHQDEGESEEATAIRELAEETGITDVHIDCTRIFSERYMVDRRWDKTVIYYIGFVERIDNDTPQKFKKEIPQMRWLSYSEAAATIREQTRPLLEEAWEYLQKSLE